jgi:hypothetical protein
VTKLKNSVMRPRKANLIRRLLAAAAISCVPAASLAVISATPAYAAAGPCYHGIYDWHSGWGGCQGNGWYRVHLSCTWGQSAASPWVKVEGGWSSVGLTCPYNSAIREVWMEY